MEYCIILLLNIFLILCWTFIGRIGICMLQELDNKYLLPFSTLTSNYSSYNIHALIFGPLLIILAIYCDLRWRILKIIGYIEIVANRIRYKKPYKKAKKKIEWDQ